MSFLFYYILRKIFVKLRFSDKEISFEKGLILKRTAVIPFSSIVKITAKRTIIMRLFRAKEITVFTLGGKIKFYLPKNEPLPFLPQTHTFGIKPRFLKVAFGAFIDTRALGGVFVFTAVLRRISAVFGSEYFNRVISVLTKTADELENALKFLRIAVPKIAITMAVFALGSWVFAYIRKLLRLSRFRIAQKDGLLFVKSGVLTLYEHTLVLNYTRSSSSAAVIYCDTFTTVLTRCAPLYCRGVMICPCVKRVDFPKTLKTLCGIKVRIKKLSSPNRAFLGHIAVPLSWLGVFSASLAAAYCFDHSVMLLKTVLYSGAIVNLYTAALYILYMYRAGIAFNNDFTIVSARRGLRLYTAVFPDDIIKQKAITQSIFQRHSGLCNFRLAIVEHKKFTVRQLSKIELLRRTLF